MNIKEIMNTMEAQMKKYWKYLCDEHGIHPEFDVLTTNQYIKTHIEDMLSTGIDSIGKTDALASAIANVGMLMEGDRYMVSNHIIKVNADGTFTYNTRTTAHYETLLLSVMAADVSTNCLFELIKILMDHEFGHCLVFAKVFGECHNVNEFSKVLTERSVVMQKQIEYFEKEVHHKVSQEEFMTWYNLNITEEAEANSAMNVNIPRMIHLSTHLRNIIERDRFSSPSFKIDG